MCKTKDDEIKLNGKNQRASERTKNRRENGAHRTVYKKQQLLLSIRYLSPVREYGKQSDIAMKENLGRYIHHMM